MRVFLCNLLDEARETTLEFRGRVLRKRLLAGELAEVTFAGHPLDRETLPSAPDLTGAALVETPA